VENLQEAFARICALNGLLLSKEQIGLLGRYVNLLEEWNSRVNLVSRNDIQNVWFNHILHSLSILIMVTVPSNLRVLDLGSGGGLPGLPIAIARGDLEVSLLDSVRKKVDVLRDIVNRLKLPNTSVIAGRAENVSTRGPRGFDLIVARAVGPLSELIDWSNPLVRKKSTPQEVLEPKRQALLGTQFFHLPCLLAMKGGDLAKEIGIARKRTGKQKITSIDIVLEGSCEQKSEDKKIVVVEL
jgi:16S rRNA (guanine527-N7)-methyltransferase